VQGAGFSVVLASGLVFELVRTGLALLLVSALALVGLRLLSRRGLLGAKVEETGPLLRVLRRLPLGPRSSVYVVSVGERTLVLGVGDGAPPTLIVDLGTQPPARVPGPMPAPTSSAEPPASGGA
jgi:flagellar biogenesis protein FliO